MHARPASNSHRGVVVLCVCIRIAAGCCAGVLLSILAVCVEPAVGVALLRSKATQASLRAPRAIPLTLADALAS